MGRTAFKPILITFPFTHITQVSMGGIANMIRVGGRGQFYSACLPTGSMGMNLILEGNNLSIIHTSIEGS